VRFIQDYSSLDAVQTQLAHANAGRHQFRLELRYKRERRRWRANRDFVLRFYPFLITVGPDSNPVLSSSFGDFHRVSFNGSEARGLRSRKKG
jgi:hypothetical protein